MLNLFEHLLFIFFPVFCEEALTVSALVHFSEMDTGSVAFVIIGGGIAGVSCAETLVSSNPDITVTIISASSLIKAVRNVRELGRTLVSFDIDEMSISDYVSSNSRIKVVNSVVLRIDHLNQTVVTDKGDNIPYNKLCMCTGASCKTIFPENEHVIGLRDTTSATELDMKLAQAQRIIVVGNGGIATELVFQAQNCDVVWVIKDKSIGHVFFDPGAAEFLLPIMYAKHKTSGSEVESPTKRMTYKINKAKTFEETRKVFGGALGPDWHQNLSLKGSAHGTNTISVEYQCQVKQLLNNDVNISDRKADGSSWPVYAELTNGRLLGCDFIVSATGVCPNSGLFDNLPCTFGHDRGVHIDQNMRVLGVKNVYAAGDVCCTSSWPSSDHWHQMRLWTQAKQMGSFAAQCMLSHCEQEKKGEEQHLIPDICFDIFAHVTNFFGKKVILLGRYNAQGIEDTENLEFLLRSTTGEEYIKVVMLHGRMQGAVLIGETDLEETFENLILNGTDLSTLGEDLLNPCIDIADYFD